MHQVTTIRVSQFAPNGSVGRSSHGTHVAVALATLMHARSMVHHVSLPMMRPERRVRMPSLPVLLASVGHEHAIEGHTYACIRMCSRVTPKTGEQVAL